jgi:hypothetical protein
MSNCGRCVGSCKCGLKLPVRGVTYKGYNDNYMPSGSHKCQKCKGYYIGTCACAPQKSDLKTNPNPQFKRVKSPRKSSKKSPRRKTPRRKTPRRKSPMRRNM